MEIVYTKTDEAPALATASFLPIIRAFLSKADIKVTLKDISLAARIISQFPDYLESSQREEDALSELGKTVLKENANVIKLPNISASVAQLKAAISELQGHGYAVPNFPENPNTDQEKEIKARYSKVLGSAVNPVLREGNSDRRVARPVKEYAKSNPHRMGEWTGDSKTSVISMSEGDFFQNEKAHVATESTSLKIVLKNNEKTLTLKEGISVDSGDLFDASYMNTQKLCSYFQTAFEKAESESLLPSLHMKATMMKVSDPIIFGHAVKSYFKDVFEKYSGLISKLQINANLGLADVIKKLESAAEEEAKNCLQEIQKKLEDSTQGWAMVNSDKGITNLHFPNDVIIDASMPAMIREGGKMWNGAGKTQDTLAMIPDRSYAPVYQKTVEYCQKNGALKVSELGTVANVGLMAKKAQEYGSHDKTFEIPFSGTVSVVDGNGQEIFSHDVQQGDIWRMCLTKNVAIEDWFALSFRRSQLSGSPVIFWLNSDRAHDAELKKKLEAYVSANNCPEHEVFAPEQATEKTLEIITKGNDVIAATGNVLRDYLTDLFPILELGTSAKMLSIVPLLNGGALFETGAGGSAPKHVQQLEEENHLRWDSLGEFLALAVSLDDLAEKTKNPLIAALGRTLDQANFRYLSENKAPSRKTKELDNRGTHFYLSLFWAEALAEEKELNDKLLNKVQSFAATLKENEATITSELIECQGKSVDLGGYFWTDAAKTEKVMRPSKSFNEAVEAFSS